MMLAQRTDLGLTGQCEQRIFVQPVLIQRPFHETKAQPFADRKLILPTRPREGLDTPIDQRRQTALHEANAVVVHLVLNRYGVGASLPPDRPRAASQALIWPTMSTPMLSPHNWISFPKISPTLPAPI